MFKYCHLICRHQIHRQPFTWPISGTTSIWQSFHSLSTPTTVSLYVSGTKSSSMVVFKPLKITLNIIHTLRLDFTSLYPIFPERSIAGASTPRCCSGLCMQWYPSPELSLLVTATNALSALMPLGPMTQCANTPTRQVVTK